VLPAETQVELLARAGGNPLYAEEFARMLRDRGTVGDLPETVQGLIAARLDLLEPEQKSLLQDAAVIGRRFWAGALASLGERGRLETGLHALERKEFARRERASTVDGDSEYSFRHLLVRDVAYGQIPRADRAEKHLLAARWVEQLGRREDHAEMLAHHYLQALELTTAAGGSTDAFSEAARRALTDAGDRVVALNSHVAAARFYRAALDLLPAEDPARGRLLLRLGRALATSGSTAAQGEADFEMLAQARDELLEAGDDEGAADAETQLCIEYWLLGDHDAAMTHLDEARRLVDPLPPSRSKALVIATASRLLMLASKEREAIVVGEQGLAMAEALGLDDIRAASLVNIGSARTALNENRGFVELAEGIELARKVGAAFDMCRGVGNLAARQWARGELSEAIRHWHQAERESEEFGQMGFARWFHAVLAAPEYELGEWDTADVRAREFLVGVEAGSPHYLASPCYLIRGLISHARADRDGAIADMEVALELARRAKDPQSLYPACAVASHVLMELGEPDRALPPAEEFLAGLEGGPEIGFADTYLHILAWTLTGAGRGEECAAALEPYARLPWTQIGITFCSGNATGAADRCAEIGALASEAHCRLAAARAGDLGQLERALAFYRSVGATRYVSEGESLLAASA
jgi:hypothetical protein